MYILNESTDINSWYISKYVSLCGDNFLHTLKPLFYLFCGATKPIVSKRSESYIEIYSVFPAWYVFLEKFTFVKRIVPRSQRIGKFIFVESEFVFRGKRIAKRFIKSVIIKVWNIKLILNALNFMETLWYEM